MARTSVFPSKMILLVSILSIFSVKYVNGVSSQCSVSDVKSLLEGCDRLNGLNITSVGGTMVNDHNCDVVLPKQVFMEEPLFQYSLADSKKFYTILVVDPDAPPQVEGEFYLHMLKSNIPGLGLKAKESSKTIGIDYRVEVKFRREENWCSVRDVASVTFTLPAHKVPLHASFEGPYYIIGYKPPMPPRGTGPHRYFSLLYEQGDGNNFLPTVPSSRTRFLLANWLRGKNLCGPIAGTLFRSQF